MQARLWLGTAILGLTACGGGSGEGSSSSSGSFHVLGVNVAPGQVWKINRALEVRFSQDVDFSTVSLNTVKISDGTGISAIGYFYQPTDPETGQLDPRRVTFQPTCPSLEDFSDAGLVPGRTYTLTVSASNGAPTLASTSGEALTGGILRSFVTPDSTNPLELFQDSVPGPPRVIVLPERPEIGEVVDPDTAATHVEIGGVKRFFGRDETTQEGQLEPGLKLPLSHYSLPENQVAFVLQFDQSILASSTNLSRVRLEYDSSSGWERVSAVAELEGNCTQDGARVRVEPRGILPQNRGLRVVVQSGFLDLSGDPTTAIIDDVALAYTLTGGSPNPLFPDIDNPEVDEVLEAFAFEELEDQTAVFPVPAAHWQDGRLEANFAFGGTGGPGGDFDWHIPPGTELVLDTNSDVIFGGPGGAQTGSQPVIGGTVDIRDLYLPPSSTLRIVGPNTCTILASGTVRILGEVYLSGSDNPGVATLNTANFPEAGAVGQAGGGDGGTGSYLTTQSTPRGGAGFGAFQAQNGGGEGGETSYGAVTAASRRGAGGGGGSLGPDVYYDHDEDEVTEFVRCQLLVGLDVEFGNAGGPLGKGAENNVVRAAGGKIAPSPFVDPDPLNNFLGTKLTSEGQLILGELDGVLAGSGGGGGGDSVNGDTFPHPNFGPMADEKGAGGGGGAGGLRILAIGPIIIGNEDIQGSILAEGGNGGGGENGGLRIGGGSGGGSGGHIILSSAIEIVVHGMADFAGPWYDDAPDGHGVRSISAAGGQGGAGNFNRGGASFGQTLPWLCDRVPLAYFPYTNIPPYNRVCFQALPDIDDPEGPCVGAGGDGGPGLIQFHVEDPDDIRFPEIEATWGGTYSTGLDVTAAVAPPPLGWKVPGETPDQMIPFFGRLSMTRSKWIPLGLARENASGSADQVVLHGIGGVVQHGAGETTLHEDPILGPEVLAEPTFTISLDASGLAPEDSRYLENPALLRRATVRLEDSLDADLHQHFVIVSATYDEDVDRLEVSVDPNGPSPAGFEVTGEVLALLVPQTLRIETAGVLDSYPADNDIIIEYDATVNDPVTGLPSKLLSYSATHGDELTRDIGDLNLEAWDYFRFQVIFDLDTAGGGVNPTAPRPSLDHLRVQFEF